MTALNRGDICLIDFNPAKGGEIGKLRPAVIMSTKEEIEVLDTVIVIPLSTVIEENTKPYRLLLEKRDNLHRRSDACVYEIRALSKQRIKKKIAQVTSTELSDLQKCLCELLD